MTDLFSGDHESHPARPQTRSERRRAQRRQSRRRKNIVSFVVMVAALVLLVGGGWVFIKPLFAPPPAAETIDFAGPGAGGVEVVIAEGDSGAAIGSSLVDAGVVKTVEAFTKAYSTNPNATSIQAGMYTLPEGMRAVDAVAALLDSAYRSDLRITVPEGWTAAQVYERVANNLDVSEEDVEEAATAVGDSLPGEAEGNLEGWLAPSTYTIEPDSRPEDVLDQMVELTHKTLADLDVAESKQQEIIVKASIVEKEVPAKYWGEVARVIENRLGGCSGDKTLGMDTTLVYAFGKNYNEISSEEMRESPYNGRVNSGLPPTPIGSPSVGAIEAVLDPPDGPWCYFVTVNLETQETRFTDDFDEHLSNQEEYRAYLKEQRTAAEDEDDDDVQDEDEE